MPLLRSRDVPLIEEFVAEHEAVTDLGGDAVRVRALDAGDRVRAAASSAAFPGAPAGARER
ncbi:hypothetical protein ACFU3J_16775 [Streptomyces sp. NPDC057411]|uniref:hypothetical protein n=1 Tax=unclassified Streptomyces TaxID=2593676 RepID=UPI0036276C73